MALAYHTRTFPDTSNAHQFTIYTCILYRTVGNYGHISGFS